MQKVTKSFLGGFELVTFRRSENLALSIGVSGLCWSSHRFRDIRRSTVFPMSTTLVVMVTTLVTRFIAINADYNNRQRC